MKRVAFNVVLVLLCSFCSSQSLTSFSALTIADSLKNGAHTVYHLDEGHLEIISPSKYVFKVHQIATILNPEGNFRLRHVLSFDKFRVVSEVSIKIYNSLGLLVKKYSKKDFEVEAAFDGISLATDDKLMKLITPLPAYPATIEIEYLYKVNSYIELPDWYLNNYKTGVELFRYTVIVPEELDIRHRSLKLNIEPTISIIDKKKTYTWEQKNIKPLSVQEQVAAFPKIEIAPNAFEYDGYYGTFKSWSDFGKWNYSLYQEKTPFSEQRIREIRGLVEGLTDDKQKIEVLYGQLKKSMRYVSIQFGIGGFKPFPVKFVDEKKYGDCKALTNYMRYMLNVVGIKSYPALVNAGKDLLPIDSEFPSSSFNHVILCVPLQKDTVWLECTSNSNEAGFLGNFTEDKNALLLTEDGGMVIQTPRGRPGNNQHITSTHINLTEDGGADATIKLFATGDMTDAYREMKRTEGNEQQEIAFSHLNYKQANDFAFSFEKDSSGGQIYRLDLVYDKLYSFKAGDKWFYPLQLKKLVDGLLKKEKAQHHLFDQVFVKTDTTVFHLPKGFTVDELPQSQELKNENAFFKRSVIQLSDSKIKITTTLRLEKRIIPANEYSSLVKFLTWVEELESQSLILKKMK